MKSNPKIAVIGIGGVGGFIGGCLAKEKSDVTFVARGKKADYIKKNGITIHSDVLGDFISYPFKIVENISDLHDQDIIFICVKEYSLEEISKQLKNVINKDTILIPIMNGLNIKSKIKSWIPEANVVESVIYIVSHMDEQYSVHQEGSYAHIHIGTEEDNNFDLEIVRNILHDAKVDCVIEKKIKQEIWKKYIFNCAFNVVTAYYQTDVQGMRQNPQYLEEYNTLMEEAALVAKSRGVFISKGYIQRQYYYLETQMEGNATSSLKRDIENRKRSELETFSGELCHEARSLGIELPLTQKFYVELKQRCC